MAKRHDRENVPFTFIEVKKIYVEANDESTEEYCMLEVYNALGGHI